MPAVDEREAQLTDLTEQCLELMDQLAEASRERDRLRERCAEVEDELSRTQRDTLVARERISWLEEVLSHMHRTSKHMNAEGLEKLKSRALAAADAGPVADLAERFERLGKGIDLEHQLKAGLINLVNRLKDEAAAARKKAAGHQDAEQQLRRVQAELAAARTELVEGAAKADASAAELQRVHAELQHIQAELQRVQAELQRVQAELEQERSSRKAEMQQLREARTTIRELRAILGLNESEPQEALAERIRKLQATISDRDRWVLALLSELDRRRLKLTRRGLTDYERRFVQDRERAEGP